MKLWIRSSPRMCSLHRQGFVICRHWQTAFHFNDFNVKLLCQGPFTYIVDILGTQSIGQIGSGLVWFDLAKRWNNTETSHIFALCNGLQLLTFADWKFWLRSTRLSTGCKWTAPAANGRDGWTHWRPPWEKEGCDRFCLVVPHDPSSFGDLLHLRLREDYGWDVAMLAAHIDFEIKIGKVSW